jgi:tetratricopeptide (TPR) repeat protein
MYTAHQEIAMPALVLAALALQVAAMDDPAQRHETCLALISQDAETAYEEALAWRHQGGGWPSEHCVSLALIALGHAEPGALRLRAAAEGAVTATDMSRAIMFGQAGDGFLQAESPDHALAAFQRGLDFAPGDAGLKRGVAQAALALEDPATAESAAGDAAGAAQTAAARAEALRLRAEARLALGALETALADVEAARSDQPEDIEILLLRGRINEAIRQQQR